jgi:hypothetical protein
MTAHVMVLLYRGTMRAPIAASVTALALCTASTASTASAEVFLDDSTIEVSGEYTYQPVTFVNQTEASTGTGVHFEDRNGVFARFVVKLLRGAPDRSKDDPYQWSETGKTTSYLSGGIYETTTFFKGTLKEGYKTPEEREERHREKLARASAIDAFNDYSTEVRVWKPRDTDDALASNIEGAAIGMTTSLLRTHRVSLETGVRWEDWRSNTCMDANGASTCRNQFFGMPITVLVSLGWLGRAEVGYDFNWRANGRIDGVSKVSPIRASLTIDILNRAFVRARALTTVDDFTNPGFALEVGGRI